MKKTSIPISLIPPPTGQWSQLLFKKVEYLKNILQKKRGKRIISYECEIWMFINLSLFFKSRHRCFSKNSLCKNTNCKLQTGMNTYRIKCLNKKND